MSFLEISTTLNTHKVYFNQMEYLLILSESKMINFIYFYFFLLFYFLFILFYFSLRVRVSVISHMTVTNCYISWSHNHMSQKNIKYSEIIMSYHILIVYSIYIL